jgi:hypothetical protein
MAQAYQLPGEFRAGDLSAAAAYSGDQTARDQEVMNNFIKQYDATTNITNANRMQSLRERQFAQEMINADRNFQLTKDQQEYNFQTGTRDFDLKKEYQQAQLRNFDINAQQAQWNLQMQKDTYGNQKEALSLAPSWNDELKNRLGPQGAYGPNADEVIAGFILEKGVNPGYRAVLDQMVIPYKQQAETYKANAFDAVIAKAEAYNSRGELDKIFFQDPDNFEGQEINGRYLLYKMKEARDKGDTYGLMAYKAKLELGLADFNREKTARIQAQAIEQASNLGVPVEQVDVKDGVITARFEREKLAAGARAGGAGGGSGAGLAEKFAGKSEQEAMAGFKIDRDTAKGVLDAADQNLRGIDKNSAEYAVVKENRDAAYNDYVIAQNIYENNARKLSAQPAVETGNKIPTTQTPSGTTAPAVTPLGAPAGSIDPLDYLNKPKTTTPNAPMSATGPDAAEALLSPRTKQIGSIVQTAEMLGNTALRGAKLAALGPTLVSGSEIGGNVGSAVGGFVKDVGPAMKELAAVRELRRKAQLAANTRADRGENPTVAYQEELQKLVNEYQARNQPQISVR